MHTSQLASLEHSISRRARGHDSLNEFTAGRHDINQPVTDCGKVIGSLSSNRTFLSLCNLIKKDKQ